MVFEIVHIIVYGAKVIKISLIAKHAVPRKSVIELRYAHRSGNIALWFTPTFALDECRFPANGALGGWQTRSS